MRQCFVVQYTFSLDDFVKFLKFASRPVPSVEAANGIDSIKRRGNEGDEAHRPRLSRQQGGRGRRHERKEKHGAPTGNRCRAGENGLQTGRQVVVMVPIYLGCLVPLNEGREQSVRALVRANGGHRQLSLTGSKLCSGARQMVTDHLGEW